MTYETGDPAEKNRAWRKTITEAGGREARLVIGICLAAFSVVLGMAASASQTAPPQADKPLLLKKQGTFYVGGTIEFRTPNTTNPAAPASGTAAPGHIAVNQMYVEYQIPEDLKYKYPIVFVHGGGHTGQIFRSTPDEREGWFTSFTRRGFAVYAVDGANRGRAGWDPTNRIAATAGLVPPSSMETVNIYTKEDAWTAFRWGPTFGTFYPNTQFPKAYVDDYIKQIQPAYRDLPPPAAQVQNSYIPVALGELVDKIGPCILLGWSTGGGNVLVAATSTPARMQKVKGLIGIEGFPGDFRNRADPALVAKIPVLAVIGDHTSPAGRRAFTTTLTSLGGDATTIFLPDIGIFGNGHTMMAELNSEQIADVLEKWIMEHVK